MPWIDKEKCIGCGNCVDECPVDTIEMVDDIAEIDMSGCIHCGICHDTCEEDAVRHDSEKIPGEVKDNVEETKKFMDDCEKYLGDKKERQKCLKRMIRHYNYKRKVMENTLNELNALKAN